MLKTPLKSKSHHDCCSSLSTSILARYCCITVASVIVMRPLPSTSPVPSPFLYSRTRVDFGVVVGSSVVGATVVGSTVVGATVVGATVVGATVVGATVVGATVVGATVVGATVVGATVVGAVVVG